VQAKGLLKVTRISRREASSFKKLGAALLDADVLLIVPPFADLDFPSLAVPLLQACGRAAGFRVQILYANLLLAAFVGEANYSRICGAPSFSFARERFFARAAFGLPPLGRRARRMFESSWILDSAQAGDVEACSAIPREISRGELMRLEGAAEGFVAAIASAVAARPYKIVGCTTTFEQTCAGIALLKRVKRLRPGIVTILGGANCEGEMGEGLAALGTSIDYVFSGESEASFPAFVRGVLEGRRPARSIIRGEPCRDMDRLPTPVFEEYFEQRALFLPDSSLRPEEIRIPYETSRGCWWGQKHHCTFCGLNGEGMAFRQKSAARVLEEMRELLRRHPTRQIEMTDNIMPRDFFKTLFPLMAGDLEGVKIFYEQKANLSLRDVAALQRAGITWIQPGIEALSTPLLQRMRKGVQARQNLLLLRFARAARVRVSWNLLWGFPGDEERSYGETLALLPLLHHLEPPIGLWHLSLDRFSPYYFEPEQHGVKALRPLAGYYDFLPKGADVPRIAYHFVGDYECDSHARLDLIAKISREVTRWKAAWASRAAAPPELRISRSPGGYELSDTRSNSRRKAIRALCEEEASFLLTATLYSGAAIQKDAVRDKLAVVMDGWFVPLATAELALFEQLSSAPQRAIAPVTNPLSIIGEATA
jgi:ribosomal peptide maturation radical SAM protein 1